VIWHGKQLLTSQSLCAIIPAERKLTTMELTEAQRNCYLKTSGVKCPFCDSGNVEAGGTKTNEYDEGIHCRVSCGDCGKSWIDYYALVDIVEEKN
jgi:transposase-like protein